MEGFLNRILPSGGSNSVHEDDEEVEYSFASEYSGPPLASCDLPRYLPVDIKRIPTASVVSSTSLSSHLSSLPVVQPLFSRDSAKNKQSKEPTSASHSVVSPTSVIAFEQSDPDGHDCGLSREVNDFCTLGFRDGRNKPYETLEVGVGSKGRGNSRELSRSALESSNLSHGSDQSHEFSIEREISGSLASSGEPDDTSNLPPNHARRVSFVTFPDAELSDSVRDDFSTAETAEEVQYKPKELEATARKVTCHRCLKGNWFTVKEACIVCNAKYCSNCVLGAMGSMPEGRKCISCIGYPIDESKRGSLGKCSRMLGRLLNKLETRQIMEVEKSCEVNQLHPECIYVNGKQLCQEELVLLQTCPNPPTKLKPGSYWYDKLSGFWGKEGQKPCKIISPHLNVGGHIMREASNGNTNVVINNREITKVELRMLWLAGVQYAGILSFWLDECGNYREEGQNKEKGNLWDSAGIKLICAVLSLPTPSKIAIPSAEEVNKLVSGAFPDYLKQRKLQKLLLVGYNGSGSCTIYKQAKLLYKAEPFSDEELRNLIIMIQKNVYCYLGVLLESRERFEQEDLTETRNKQSLDQPDGCTDQGDSVSIFSIGPRLKAFSEWLLKIMVAGNLEAIFPAACSDYAPLVEELWKDTAIQATYNRARDLQLLPSVAGYFLERVVRISRTDYEPSNMDILYAEGITSSNGLAFMDFSFSQSAHASADAADQHDPLLRYQLIRIHAGGLQENSKLLGMFEGVRLVIFCVALSDYDQFCDDGTGTSTNKILASRKLFEGIVTHPTFEKMNFLLILNKFDLLEAKIEHVPLNKCSWFSDFVPVISRDNSNNSNHNNYTSVAEQAYQYIAFKFKRLFSSLTNRKLYVSLVKALEQNTVDEALRYSGEILKWEDRAKFSTSEYSNFSTEASSLTS